MLFHAGTRLEALLRDALCDPLHDALGNTLHGGLLSGGEELVWPTRCVRCNAPGSLLCEECRTHLAWIGQRWACPVCGAPFGWLTCTECTGDWELRTTTCALVFAGTAARMATVLKDEHELRLAPVLASAMATSLDEASAWAAPDGNARFDADRVDALCFVPVTQAACLRRGFDHMELVTRALAAELALPVADVLARDPARDQRTLDRRGRAANLEGGVHVVDDVRGARLLLLDDIVTTGASMRACARALISSGAAEVGGCALARVW